MITRTKGIAAGIGLLALVGAVGLVIAQNKGHQPKPLYTTGTDVPDAKKAGNVENAMRTARQLMDYLQANHFPDAYAVPKNLRHLPDQKYAENPAERDEEADSFTIVEPDINLENPEMAFFCELYARENTSYYKGDIGISQPNGFVIVGYRNGSIKKIPLDEVRMIACKLRKGMIVPCFPGSCCYRTDLPKAYWKQITETQQNKLMAEVEKSGSLASEYHERNRRSSKRMFDAIAKYHYDKGYAAPIQVTNGVAVPVDVH